MSHENKEVIIDDAGVETKENEITTAELVASALYAPENIKSFNKKLNKEVKQMEKERKQKPWGLFHEGLKSALVSLFPTLEEEVLADMSWHDLLSSLSALRLAKESNFFYVKKIEDFVKKERSENNLDEGFFNFDLPDDKPIYVNVLGQTFKVTRVKFFEVERGK